MYGVPATLLIFKRLPIVNGTTDPGILLVVLGFGTSTTVDPTRSISYPLTYAVPAETFTETKSSLGVFPSSVTSSDLNNPPFPVSSFKHSAVSTTKLSTA